MESVSTSTTCAAHAFRITAKFDVWESGTSVAGNYSTVSWHLTVTCTDTAGWTNFGGSTRNRAGWVYCGIDGNQVYGGYTGLPHGMTNGTVLVDQWGSTNVGHNNDGTKSVSFFVDLDQSDDDYGRINYYFYDGPRSTGTLGLSTIARASQPSINTWPGNSPDITAGTACAIHMNQASASFTHTVKWSFGSLSNQTGGLASTSGIRYNVSWTPPISMMNQIPNATSGSGTVSVTTYNGGTAIGTKTVPFTLHQPSDSAPGMSVSYAEAGTLADGKTTLSSKGIGSKTVVGQISVKKITISASAKYGSSIKEITCSHNVQTQISSSSSATFTFNAPVNTGSNKSYFSWTVKDSRGNTSQDSIAMDFIPYHTPIIGTLNPKRSNTTASTGMVSIDGSFYNGLVGSISNSISVSIKYNGTTVSPTLTKSGNTFSGSASISDIDPSGYYSFTAKATDSLGFFSSRTVVLAKASPTLWVGEETVRINSYEVINSTVIRTAYRITDSIGLDGIEYLGNWSGSLNKSALHLQYFGGIGFGDEHAQNIAVDIFAQNAVQFKPSANRAFGVMYEIHGIIDGRFPFPGLFKVSAYATSDNSLNLYMMLPPYYDGYITVEYTSGKWTPYATDVNMPHVAVTGTLQDCRLYIPGYPIGSIYTSLDSTSPVVLLGGSWESVDDLFQAASRGGGSVYRWKRTA